MEKEEIHRLFIRYYERMNRVARSILCDEQESEDVISDIFEYLLNHNVVLIPDTEERYLLTSVRNQCVKRVHHQEVHQRMIANAMADDYVDTDVDERLDDVMEIVENSLAERDKRIFTLRFTEGNSYEDISVIEGISKVAVWKHLSQIIKCIKEQLNNQNYVKHYQQV